MTMAIRSKKDMEAVAVKEGVEDEKLEKLIREQRVVALQEKRLDAALEELLKLEKEARSTGDAPRIQRVAVAIVQLCYDARAWKTLIKQILFLSQRPDQLNQAIVAMVQQAVSYLNDIPDLDTRNELAEALNNVSSSKGLQSLCWYLLLTPHESLSGQSKTQMADLDLSGIDLSCESQEERAERQFQESTQQQVLSPDFESRPTTPPQQRMRVKDMSPSVCRAPLKKKPYIIRKPMGPVRRRLFSQATPSDVEEFLSELEQSNHQRFIDRYNFDPVKEKPLPGRFEWSPQRLPRPELTRATSVDSSTEVRKSELASTLSA
ncbi:hypothetical protein M758_10G100500 [Ceratodon purpureus]|uniref:Cyclin-dependent kinase inhibitor domain-containing protein n=1 Tax=Ceratodon purpureus TaxID=3225 RepID=A0A8T0GK90_CERPU|nr:hypothetical protein KC19_10G103600 [Ceratodon purpureus]KAG0603533.1 hypothetical protein M758_10G100500 [Ceratodon purpureus]